MGPRKAALIASATLVASACVSGRTLSWRLASYSALSSLASSARMPSHSSLAAEITSELLAGSATRSTLQLPGLSASTAAGP